MTYITDIQDIRKAEKSNESPAERRNSVRLRIERETAEYVKKHEIQQVPSGFSKDSTKINWTDKPY